MAASPIASFAQDNSAEQRIMGVAMATIEYCPGIEIRPEIVAVLAASSKNWPNYSGAESAKASAFRLLRSASSRDRACELMMQDYGPGAELHLFKFKN